MRLRPIMRTRVRRDCIFVKDWVVDCNIGVYAEEKGVTQKVRLYVDAYPDPQRARELRRRHGRCAVVHGHHRCGRSHHVRGAHQPARDCLAQASPSAVSPIRGARGDARTHRGSSSAVRCAASGDLPRTAPGSSREARSSSSWVEAWPTGRLKSVLSLVARPSGRCLSCPAGALCRRRTRGFSARSGFRTRPPMTWPSWPRTADGAGPWSPAGYRFVAAETLTEPSGRPGKQGRIACGCRRSSARATYDPARLVDLPLDWARGATGGAPFLAGQVHVVLAQIVHGRPLSPRPRRWPWAGSWTRAFAGIVGRALALVADRGAGRRERWRNSGAAWQKLESVPVNDGGARRPTLRPCHARPQQKSPR